MSARNLGESKLRLALDENASLRIREMSLQLDVIEGKSWIKRLTEERDAWKQRAENAERELLQKS